MRSASLGGCVVLAALAFGTAAGAQSRGGATAPERLIDEGIRLREAGHDQEALARFRQAYEQSRSPRALAQVALAEQALGLWLDASRDIAQALAAGSDPWIRRNHAALEGARDTIAQHVGQLEVLGNVPGAQVLVDGAVVGTLPLASPLRVAAGNVRLEVRAEGYVPVTRSVRVEPAAMLRESVQLARESGGSLDARGRAGLLGSGNAPGGRGGAPDTVGTVGTVGVVLLASGGVLLVGGVVAHVLREGFAAQWNDPMCLANGLTREQSCADRRSGAELTQALAITGYAAGGALAVLGAVLAATQGGGAREQPRPVGAVRCGVGPGALGIACDGVF